MGEGKMSTGPGREFRKVWELCEIAIIGYCLFVWSYRRVFMTKNPNLGKKNKQTNPDNQKRKIKHWLALFFSKDQTDIGKQEKTVGC